MFDIDDLIIFGGFFMAAVLFFALGMVYGEPTELENGCIVHNNKVYCEEVNKVED